MFDLITELPSIDKYNIIMSTILVVFLGIASIVDIERREIPVCLCFFIAIFSGFLHWHYETGFVQYIIAGLLLLIVYFLFALRTQGGGDVIMMGMFGFCVGLLGSIVSIIISGILLFLYGIFRTIKSKKLINFEYPVAPFTFLGYMGYLILLYAGALDGFKFFFDLLFLS